MRGKIVLVTGGVRSGKSKFAERYVAALCNKVAYIATAQMLDTEMTSRIALHRARRPKDWLTYEAPFNAEKAMLEALDLVNVVLLDCLTLYTSNLLLARDAPPTIQGRYHYVQQKITTLLKNAQARPATVVFVTNEVGMGIVPENALAREYRDLAGMVNQRIASVADEVYITVCGLAFEVKKLASTIKECGMDNS